MTSPRHTPPETPEHLERQAENEKAYKVVARQSRRQRCGHCSCCRQKRSGRNAVFATGNGTLKGDFCRSLESLLMILQLRSSAISDRRRSRRCWASESDGAGVDGLSSPRFYGALGVTARWEECLMNLPIRVGMDTSKSVFQLHGVDEKRGGGCPPPISASGDDPLLRRGFRRRSSSRSNPAGARTIGRVCCNRSVHEVKLIRTSAM